MGAKVIRAYEKENGVNVPWTLLIHLDTPTDKPLNLSELVRQGQALGIYTYFVFVGNAAANLDDILHVAAQYASSAFLLLAGDEATNQRMAENDALSPNTVFVPRGGGEGYNSISEMLAQKKRMFGLNCEYNATNAEFLLSDAFLETVTAQGYPFLFLIAAPDCDGATRALVYQRMLAIRSVARYPLFPIDLLTDVQQVDHIISDERCMLELNADGSLRYPAEGSASIADLPLEVVIRQTMPRIRRHR